VTNIVEESGPPIGFRAKGDDSAKLHIASRVRASFRVRARARVHRSASVADVSFVRAIPHRSAETSSERATTRNYFGAPDIENSESDRYRWNN